MQRAYFEELAASERRTEERRALFQALRERQERSRGLTTILHWLFGG